MAVIDRKPLSQNVTKEIYLRYRIRVARWFVFKPKIPIFGKICRALEMKMLL
jgi:hypothetical protein